MFSAAPASIAASQLQTVEQKQKAASQKVLQLKKMEVLTRNKLYKNQQKLEDTTTTLKVSKNKYNNLESQLVTMERDFTRAMAEFDSLNAGMQGRIRQVFKNQRTGMFTLIFAAKDLNSLLDILYFEKLVIKNDYNRMMAVKIKSQSIAKMKNDIENRKQSLAQSMNDIKAQEKDIKSAIAKNESELNKLRTNRAYYEKTERELARQSDNIRNMIHRNSGGGTVVASSGVFAWPINGKITSPFGWRTHPIFKSRSFHSGIDIAGPNYGAIRASNSGKVIFSGWYGGYGKVVIVDHGNVSGSPTTTLYAHLSAINVSQGQLVNKGDIIGKEGTTGYSTGPHCHFEVRVDGKPNNPRNYI